MHIGNTLLHSGKIAIVGTEQIVFKATHVDQGCTLGATTVENCPCIPENLGIVEESLLGREALDVGAFNVEGSIEYLTSSPGNATMGSDNAVTAFLIISEFPNTKTRS